MIDGGNSYYRDDLLRAKRLAAKGLHHVDCGTSGGIVGLERGYCLMIGGETDVVRRLDPIFATPRPEGSVPRPRTKDVAARGSRGYLHCGPNGAGHFVKMVHNGIEYGMMAAYAEGLNILKHAGVGKDKSVADAETTPLRDPSAYQYDLDLPDIAEVWRRGSVIASWLLDLTAAALANDPSLDHFRGRVSDSGEGRWTLEAAVDEAVPANVLAAALFSRFTSRGEADFQNRLLSAMRSEFGGHAEKGLKLARQLTRRGLDASACSTPSSGKRSTISYTRRTLPMAWSSIRPARMHRRASLRWDLDSPRIRLR